VIIQEIPKDNWGKGGVPAEGMIKYLMIALLCGAGCWMKT